MRAKFGRDPMAGSKKVTFKFIYRLLSAEYHNVLMCSSLFIILLFPSVIFVNTLRKGQIELSVQFI